MNIESYRLEWKSEEKEKIAKPSSLGQAGINHVTVFLLLCDTIDTSRVQTRKNMTSTGTLFSISSYPSGILRQELGAGPTTICFVLFKDKTRIIRTVTFECRRKDTCQS